MDTSRIDGVKAPQHRGTPRSHLFRRDFSELVVHRRFCLKIRPTMDSQLPTRFSVRMQRSHEDRRRAHDRIAQFNGLLRARAS